MNEGTDQSSVGAVVTVELCGHWDTEWSVLDCGPRALTQAEYDLGERLV